MSRTLFLGSLTLLLVACASSPQRSDPVTDRPVPSSPKQDLVHVSIDFEPPEGWQVVGRQHYDSAEMGAMLRLRLVEWAWVRLDLFAYEVGVAADIGQGLQGIVDSHRAEMDYAVEQGSYQSWVAGEQAAFTIETHPLLASGVRLPMRIQRDGAEQGSTSYLFYRPPFALKVRASYPGHVDERTEQAIDDAVRLLIPAVEVHAPIACEGRSVEIEVPEDHEDLDEDQQAELFAVGFAAATLRHALHGCMDLAGALTFASLACSEHEALCGNPPWSVSEEP